MAVSSQASVALANAIRDGTFPDSDEVVSSNLSFATIPQLLADISKDKRELSNEIKGVNKSLGGGIDEWIAQASRVQEDIARCKKDAQSILEEHARLETRRRDVAEVDRKAGLLGAEINFTTTLQEQLQSIASISQKLKDIEELLSQEQASQAARELRALHQPVSSIRGPRVKSIVLEYEADLGQRAKCKLEDTLHASMVVSRDLEKVSLEVADAHATTTLNPILAGLEDLGALRGSLESLSTSIESVVLQPVRRKQKSKLDGHFSHGQKLEISLGSNDPSISEIIDFTTDSWSFMQSHLPPKMLQPLADILLPKCIGTLVTDWMTPAIPTRFHELHSLDELQEKASALASFLESRQWPGAAELSQWIEHAPKIWISKRKMETLDAIRKSFAESSGALHHVERVERQKAEAAQPTREGADDDWNASWEEDNADHEKRTNASEPDTSAWGFEDDEDPASGRKTMNNNDSSADDKTDDDAWGWDDDDQDQLSAGETRAHKSQKANGMENQNTEADEIVLTELYSITDIPDHVIEVIGRDVRDSFSLAEEQHASLAGVAPSKGLLTLPTLALAMFRATAPTHYNTSSRLGNMNLYNDALYMTEKLRSLKTPQDLPNIEADCKTMEKFARSAYSKEMDIQRTVLTDLLDGVQGFTGCTQFPYSQEIEGAVDSTVVRVRQVYQQWKPILSTSALLQAIGNLVYLVVSKVITDIEEMEDISAPQSEKLVQLCSQISSLEDLFLAKPPAASEAQEEPIPMTAVYVPNWLKFQYLMNILDSSLVDIKFLWTEGELSLEFSPEEVVELIEALFQDSPHRKSAITAIKGHRASGVR